MLLTVDWEVCLKIFPPNSLQSIQRGKGNSGTGICPHSNLPVRSGRVGPQSPHLKWINVKLEEWQGRQASCLLPWPCPGLLAQETFAAMQCREAALAEFHFHWRQLNLSNTQKPEHPQSITVQLHSGNLASPRNLCSSITIKRGWRKKALTLELMCLTTSRGTTERSSSFS